MTERAGTRTRLISRSWRVDDIALLDFLRLAPAGTQRVYWQNRQHALSFAGYGVTAEIIADGPNRFEIVHREAEELFADAVVESDHDMIVPRLVGGFAFQPRQQTGLWAAFHGAYFVLPRLVLSRINGETWLTVNSYEGDQDSSELEHLRARLLADRALPSEYHQTWMQNPTVSHPLSQDEWHTQITEAVQRIRDGHLQKVVLSRTSEITFGDPVDPLHALSQLKNRYADCYRFLVEPATGSAFFGATPELLAWVKGSQLQTAALAGSIQRGLTQAEDDRMADQLMSSPKERHEHALVADSLRELLDPITHDLHAPETPRILKLSNIQHLYTPFRGELETGENILSVVERLHPTPALGGYPHREALAAIAEIEIEPRGWYAAPVGWIDSEGSGMFAVAIRSAVAQGGVTRLYAGAGIVADSDPDREWHETSLKFRPMLDALGIQTG